MLKIGIDLDGVVFDSETTYRTYEEIFDMKKNRNTLVNREEPRFQKRYDWSEEDKQEFIREYFMEVSKNSPIMAVFKPVYELLIKEDIELICITARGGFLEEMKVDAQRILDENNIKFDKIYWKQNDKLSICKKENIDIMIDDYYEIVKEISDNKINTLYFRDTNIKKLEENEYLKEVNNWGDIYRYIMNYIKED